VHSDVGGGRPEHESALSKIPLIWMAEEAVQAGLVITAANLKRMAYGAPKPGALDSGPGEGHDYAAPSALGMIHKSLGPGWIPLEILPKRRRYIETRRRSFFRFYFPLGEARQLPFDHEIDDAVYRRQSRINACEPRMDVPKPPPAASACLYDK
jgi:hypothetical protein